MMRSVQSSALKHGKQSAVGSGKKSNAVEEKLDKAGTLSDMSKIDKLEDISAAIENKEIENIMDGDE
jgi:hypothetical protein